MNGDTVCGSHETALELMMREISPQLIYANFLNDATAKPYAIFLNNDWEKVVISIRGTLSLEDCITDAVCHPEELAAAGGLWGFSGTGKYSHSGMLAAALKIRADLDKEGILRNIFHFNSYQPSTDKSFHLKTPLSKVYVIHIPLT